MAIDIGRSCRNSWCNWVDDWWNWDWYWNWWRWWRWWCVSRAYSINQWESLLADANKSHFHSIWISTHFFKTSRVNSLESSVTDTASVLIGWVGWAVGNTSAILQDEAWLTNTDISIWDFSFGTGNRRQFTAQGWSIPWSVWWTFLAFAVNIIESFETSTFLSVPGAVFLTNIANTVDSVVTTHTCTCLSVPLFIIKAVWSTALGRLSVVEAIWAHVALSSDNIEALQAHTIVSIVECIFTTALTTLIPFWVPLLTDTALVTNSIDQIEARRALAAGSVEERVLAACLTSSINQIVIWFTHTTFGWVEDCVIGADNACLVPWEEARIAVAVTSIPIGIRIAFHWFTAQSTDNGPKWTWSPAASIVEDRVTNTVWTWSTSNDEIVEANMADLVWQNWTNLKSEVIEVWSEADSIGGIKHQWAHTNDVVLNWGKISLIDGEGVLGS